MTDCKEVRIALLEADLAALERAGDTSVAEHLRACPACAAEAARIVRATAALDSILSARPALDARSLVARARVAAAHPPDEAAEPSGRPMRRFRPGPRWVALAAAASVAALLVWGERDRPLPGTPWSQRGGPPATVETASGDVAVIETGDPDITVIWIF